MKTINTMLLLLACVFAMHAQTFYVGAGPSMHADLPHGAFNVTVGLCNSDTTTCALLNYSGRGTLNDLKQNTLTYSSSAAVRQVMSTVKANGHVVEFFLLGNAGAAIAPTATGFSGAVGGGITYHPAKAPNFGFTGAGQ